MNDGPPVIEIPPVPVGGLPVGTDITKQGTPGVFNLLRFDSNLRNFLPLH